MLRKIILYLILLAVIGSIAYGWLNYAVVGLYDKESPKITHMYLIPKPERDTTFYFNHIDRPEVEQEIANLKEKGRPIPWHLDYNYVVSHSIYEYTFDLRPQAE